jgi:hypothetical protein
MALALLSIASALAAPQLTTIQDTLYKADGTLMNATVVITWYSFTATDTTSVGQQRLSVPIVNGIIYVQLVSNTSATPIEPYTVSYSSDGLMQYQEVWMVPPSLTPLRVSDVRISSNSVPTGSTGTGSPLGGGLSAPDTPVPIPESQVTGLVPDLAARPLKGAAYGTGRVAIVDQNGAIDTVVGNFTDCVYVNGTSGPCFDSTQLPGFSDGETPSGVVDGSNYTFGLAGQPVPAQSLLLFRNGVLQQAGFDYTLVGSVVQFASGATPQPQDTLMASYRLASLQGGDLTGGSGGGVIPVIAGSNSGVVFPTLYQQVVCSSTGTQTTSTSLATLGTCTIPGTFLGPGDRLDIRFLLAHSGGTSGFTFAVKWGITTILLRNAGVNDAMVSGRADASITGGLSQIALESFGTVIPLLGSLASAADSIALPITISFQASLGTASGDSVNLVNYSVTRLPAISHP